MTALTQAIAKHLQIEQVLITRVEEWANVLFAVVKGIGGRFVSKKVKQEQEKMETVQLPGKIKTKTKKFFWNKLYLVEPIEEPQFAEAGDFMDHDTWMTLCKLTPLDDEREAYLQEKYPIQVKRIENKTTISGGQKPAWIVFELTDQLGDLEPGEYKIHYKQYPNFRTPKGEWFYSETLPKPERLNLIPQDKHPGNYFQLFYIVGIYSNGEAIPETFFRSVAKEEDEIFAIHKVD